MTPSDGASPGRWRATPLVRGSTVVHVAAAGLVLAQPELWPWALGAVVADHGLLTAAGLWPRSRWLGPNWTRLPQSCAQRGEIALTLDDGPDETVTPRVLDLLERRRIPASFFCIGTRARDRRDLVREIVRRGHDIENHTQHHRKTFSLLGRRRIEREVRAAQEQLAEVSGSLPRFFRAPAGLRNLFLDPVLFHERLTLATWTRRGYDTRCGDPATVLRRLTRGLAAGDILLLHDGNAARTRQGTPVILEVLPGLLDAIEQAGLRPVTLRSALAPS